jgi:SAM-dependent methyltransferase
MSVRQGYFEAGAQAAPVEVVCAFHVLEHVDDPRDFLATARAALTPGGWLALEVPNIASASAVRAGGSWAHLQPGCHRWHFSPQSLTRLVEDCGFLVRRCDTISSRHYMRPRHRPSLPGISMLLADWSACGSPKTTHARLGDHLRLLARLPERPSTR